MNPSTFDELYELAGRLRDELAVGLQIEPPPAVPQPESQRFLALCAFVPETDEEVARIEEQISEATGWLDKNTTRCEKCGKRTGKKHDCEKAGA